MRLRLAPRVRNPEALLARFHSAANPPLKEWLTHHEGEVLAALSRARRRALLSVHTGKEIERGIGKHAPAPARAEGPRHAGVFGGLTLAPGTWLYGQFPGSGDADAIQLVEKEDESWKALRHGGVTPYRISTSRLHDLKSPLIRGNYLKQLGYLEQVMPEPEHRRAFVTRCQETPVREEAERQAEIAKKQAALSKHGPWFADVAAQEGLRSSVGAAWVLKKVLKKHGIQVTTGQRHYSMASGMDFTHESSDREKINRIFPGLASRSDSAHPFAHDDRSDPMTDYHSPGGFRIAPSYLEEVRKVMQEQVQSLAASAAKKEAKKPVARDPVFRPDWRPEDILIVGDGAKLWVYDVGKGIKSRDAVATAMPFAGARVFSGPKDSVQAPDLTFKKLQDKGSGLLLKYLPAIKGRRVLLRGAGWYKDSPAGKYQDYALDIT